MKIREILTVTVFARVYGYLQAHLHWDASEYGGLACTDSALLERQRAAIVEIMKTLGKNLLSGNFDLLKTSLPVKLFEARSYLQKLTDPFIFTRHLDSAASAVDPIVRMQCIITAMVAGYHRAFLNWAKPFNPILGETWEASLADGTSIFLEQVSHHPPVSAFQMVGAHGRYYFHGIARPSLTYKANAIKTQGKGHRCIEFADGGVVEVTFPAYYIRGLLYTSTPRAEVGGTAEFIDRKNGLKGVINLGKVEGAAPGSLLARPDGVSGTIYRTSSGQGTSQSGAPQTANVCSDEGASGSNYIPSRPKSSLSGRSILRMALRPTASFHGSVSDGEETVVRIPVARCQGNWLSHLDWDGQRMWTLHEEPVHEWIPNPDPLPSDCRFREDLRRLAEGDVDGAQAAKESLENMQRADAKLRKIG